METIIFRHGTSREADAFGPILDKAGMPWRIVEAWHEDISDFDPLAPDLLIVMGGQPGVWQTKDYPFLAQEIEIIKKRLEHGKPTLGICLGAQLMATALGAKSYRGGKGPERGWCEIHVNEDGMKTPLRHLDAAKTKVVQSHQDTFDLPEGVVLLASSDLYQNQAFSYGPNALALQCHPEATLPSMENRLVALADEAEAGKVDIAKMRADTKSCLSVLTKQTDLFLTEWVNQVLPGLKAAPEKQVKKQPGFSNGL